MKVTWMRQMGNDEDYVFSTKDMNACVSQRGQGDDATWYAGVNLRNEDDLEVSFSEDDFPTCADAKSWARDRLFRAQMIRDEVARILAF